MIRPIHPAPDCTAIKAQIVQRLTADGMPGHAATLLTDCANLAAQQAVDTLIAVVEASALSAGLRPTHVLAAASHMAMASLISLIEITRDHIAAENAGDPNPAQKGTVQ